MSSSNYLRLRQVCLVAQDNARASMLFREILGVDVAFRDERVSRYGLENIIMPLGTSFIEVISPVQPGTAAGRFLDRNKGRNGYMAIFDCADLAAVRERVERLGIRVLHSRNWAKYQNIQLHPRDNGAVMFEFHHNTGGDALDGYYEPAGEHWQRHIRSDVSVAITGIGFSAPDPLALAQRWVSLFDASVQRTRDDEIHISLDNAQLRFSAGGEGEHLNAIDVTVRDIDAVLRAASRQSVVIGERSVELCGVRFRLSQAQP